MAAPKRLRRFKKAGEDAAPGRLGVPGSGKESNLSFASGMPLGSSNTACKLSALIGRQGFGPINEEVEIRESGSGVPSGSSNESALDAGQRFAVRSAEEETTAQSAPPRMTAPFSLRAGHGFNGED